MMKISLLGHALHSSDDGLMSHLSKYLSPLYLRKIVDWSSIRFVLCWFSKGCPFHY